MSNEIQIIEETPSLIVGTYKKVLFNIYPKESLLGINAYLFEYTDIQDAYSQIVDRINHNRGVYLQSYRN